MRRTILFGAVLLSFVLIGSSGCGGGKESNPTVKGAEDSRLKPASPGGVPGGKAGHKPASSSE